MSPTTQTSFKGHRFPGEQIRHAVWLSVEFALRFRDVKELIAQCGIRIRYETVRCGAIKFGPQIATTHRRRKAALPLRWRLHEMVCNTNGECVILWRAVGDEGKVWDLVVPKCRTRALRSKLLKRFFRNQNVALKQSSPMVWPRTAQR